MRTRFEGARQMSVGSAISDTHPASSMSTLSRCRVTWGKAGRSRRQAGGQAGAKAGGVGVGVWVRGVDGDRGVRASSSWRERWPLPLVAGLPPILGNRQLGLTPTAYSSATMRGVESMVQA